MVYSMGSGSCTRRTGQRHPEQRGKGDAGIDGEDGTTPQLKVGSDNLWYVSYDNGVTWESLGVNATGSTGEKGEQGEQGEKGQDGLIPYIGANSNWWLGDTDTGVQASIQGEKGGTGAAGKDGANGVDGKNGTEGKDGVNGKDGINGKDGRMARTESRTLRW